MIPSRMWDGAYVLSQYIVTHEEQFIGKTVVELGAGVGLPSLICGHLAKQTVITDCNPMALKIAQNNVQLNYPTEIEDKVLVHELDWSKTPSLVSFKETFPNSFEVVLGADVLYLTSSVVPLLKTAKELLSRSKVSKFIMAHEKRRSLVIGGEPETEDTVLEYAMKMAPQLGFKVETVDLSTFLHMDSASTDMCCFVFSQLEES